MKKPLLFLEFCLTQLHLEIGFINLKGGFVKGIVS